MSAFRRIREIVRKELLQLRRDPRMSRVLLVAPVVQLVVFGYAVSTDVRNTATVVFDQDRSTASRELLETWTASGYFRIVGNVDRPEGLIDALDRGDATVALVVPPGFAADFARGEASVQVLLDGTNSNVATVAQGYAERILTTWGVDNTEIRISPPIELQERAWFNPDLASRNYNVPAVIGTIVTLVCLLLTSLAVVREREIGTLEQLLVSPIRPWELLVGKTLPFALIGLVDLVIISIVAVVWFRVPLVGNPALLLEASLLYLLSGLGVGLLISTVSSTQQEAFMSTFLVFMPMMLLSGFFFPVGSMPRFFQWVTLLNPLRYFLEIIRGIFLKGVGLEALWPQHLALLALGSSIFALAVYRFRRQVG